MKRIFCFTRALIAFVFCVTLALSVVTKVSAQCTAPASGLVGWWKGDGTAMDLVSSNNGTLFNVAYSNGVVNQAFSFDPENYSYGTYTGVKISDQPAYALTNSLTIEGWIRPRGDSYVIFFRGDGRPGLDPYSISMNGNHELWFSIGDASGNGTNILTTIPYDQWVHVAATLSGTNGQMRIYTNGVLAVQKFTSIRPFGALDVNQSPGVGIGNVNDGFNTFPFIGDVDEIGLYNRALSQSEIQAIVAAGSAGKCTSVVAVSNSAAVPVIVSFTPLSDTNGSLVTILGTNFSATASSNIVYFGAVKAVVLAASTNVLTVQIPVGATFAPITVTVGGLTAWASAPFMPTFAGGTNSLALATRLDLPAGDGPGQAIFADVDGDGKPDLLVNSGIPQFMSVYRNISTNGVLLGAASFAPRIDVVMPGNIQNAVLADVDGDGKLDIAILDRDLNTVHILKNVSTPGSITTNAFVLAVNLTTGNDPRGLVVRDLNSDGKPEIAVANWADNNVSVFRNLGTTNGITTNSFAARVNFSVGANPQDLKAADLNGDAKPDLITANNNTGTTNCVSVLRNTATGSTFSFSSQVALTGMPSSYCLAIGDLDGDGKQDLVVSSFNAGQSVSVYLNTNSASLLTTNSFAPHVDFDVGGWGNGVAIGDLDGDGKPDLAVVTQLPDHLSIFKNISTPGSFTTGSLAARVDFPTGWNPNGIAIGDLDGDGRPDIEFAIAYGATLSIYQNLSALPPIPPVTNNPATNGPPVIAAVVPLVGTNGAVITIVGTNFSATASSNIVYFGAVKANVLGAGSNVLTVMVPVGATFAPITVTVGGLTAYARSAFLPKFAGNGSGISAASLGARQNLTASSGPISTVIADIDGDGKPDLVCANVFNNSVSIYRNISAGGTITAASFSARIDLPSTAGVNTPNSVAVADVDGDGRLDIIIPEYSDNLVSVYRNNSTPGNLNTNSFGARLDFVTGISPYSATVRDMDGDGRPDILTVNNGAGTVSILRNTGGAGSNLFAAKVDFAVVAGPALLDTGDLNGDGKPDLAVSGDGFVSILQNNIVSPGALTTNAFAPHLDLAIPAGGISVRMADLDGDGQPDLATSTYLSQIFSVLRNTGLGGSLTTNSFAPRIDYALGGRGHTLAFGDLDGDGKLDVSVVSELADRLSVFRNTSTPGVFTNSSLASQVEFATGWNAWGVSVGDLDGDGRPDVVLANQYDNNLSIYQNQVPLATNAAPPPSCTTAPAGIVGWWSGENNSIDSTGTNNGTLSASGASYAAGKVGQGFRFDGTNGFVQIPDSASLKPGSVTAEAWIYLDPNLPVNRGGEQIIFKKNTWSAWFEGYSLLKQTVDNGNGTFSERFEFTVSRTGNQVVIRSQTLAQRGVWYHVAGTYDGNQSTLFVNGVAEASATPGFALDYDTTPVFIGTSGTWAPYLSMFGGIIDEPTIYSRALSTNEIATIYAAGSAGKCSPVVTPPNTNLLVNGSFENPPGIYPYQVFSTGTSMPGWVVESGTVEIHGSYWQNAEGAQSLDMNGIFEDIGTVYQDVATLPGQNYKVRFAYAGNPDCGSPTLKTANAYWNGVLLTNLSYDITGRSRTNMGWVYFEQIVTATGTNTRLRFQATSPTFCGLTLDDVSVTPTAAPVIATLVDSSSAGFYNESLGTILDGSVPQFPLPLGEGTDSTIYPATEPSLTPAASILGDWLTANLSLNGNWIFTTNIPSTWALNSETAIIYEVNGGQFGISNLLGDFDADNGVYVWVNGVFKFGARAPGLPSPTGQFEYTNINLGSLHAGTNRIQIIREDSGISTGYQIRLRGTSLTEATPVAVTLLNVDFGSGTNNGKVGLAAAGISTNDFWNFYTRDDGVGGWRTFGSLVNLKNADGSVTAAGMTVNNAPGSWGSSSTDPMYAGYIYPFDSGNVTVTITNLPAGIYDLLPYSPNGNFTLTVGTSNYPARTCIDLAASNAPVWQEGVQYVRFTNVVVTTGQPLVLTVLPGVGDNALISGLQIALSSLTNALPAQPVPPTITQQPTNVSVIVNGLATFNVTAQGTAPLTYQWSFNGTNIAGATNATLTLSNVQLALAGNYSVLVSNPGGSIVSSNAALNVLSPPFILSQTPSQVVMLGSAATFVVSAGGSAPLSYFWFKNNVLIPGATNFFYTLNNAQFVDSGKKFSCIVSNAYGTAASTNSSLKVINTIYNDLCSGAVIITNASYTNTQSTANASSYGDPVPDCVDGFGNGVWYSFTAPVSGWLAVDTLGSDFDTGLAIYAGTCGALAQVDCNDDADYFTSELEIPTTAGVTYYFLVGGYNAHVGNLVFHLNHFTPPQFDVQPTNISVVVSSNGTFSATVSGTQPISLQWFFNNTPLADGGRINGVTNATLNIANVNTNDGGNYFVVASNWVGVTTSSVAVLTPVILPPIIIVQPSPVSVFAGSNVNFTAVVDGTPPYFYQWYFGSTPLVDDGHFNGANTTSLTISNVTFADNGLYALVVTNVSGSDTSLATALTVLVAPSITLNPIGRSVPPGLPTVFTASASGSPAPKYQWQLNGTNISGATFANYTNPAISSGDLGFYQIVASNVVGVVTSSVAQLTFGPVAAWGRNFNNESLPPPGLTNVVGVAGTIGASFALRTDGTIAVWGTGSTTNIPASATNVVAMTTSTTGNSALRSDGRVVSWNGISVPVLSNIVAVAAGNNFGYALRVDGTLTNWGSIPTPGFVPSLNQITAIACGYNNAVALRSDGKVFVSGITAVTNVPSSATNVIAVAAGYTYAMALRADGKVIAWGIGSITNLPASLTNVVAISAENYPVENFGLAIRANGTVVAFGDNSSGETNPPVALSNLVSIAVAAAPFHGLALVNDGRPVIISPPIGQTAFTGRDVTLRGVAVGAAPLSYQWLLNGTNITDATNSTLPLLNLQLANAGSYQLFVSNYLGAAISIPAPLNVIVSPLSIVAQNTATPTNLYQGGKFTVSGITVNGSGPLRYQWFFSRTNNGYAALTGATNDTLIKDPALAMDTGNYYVAVSNLTSGLTSAPVNVRVQFARAWGYSVPTNMPLVTNAVAIATGGASGVAMGQYLAVGADGKVTFWTNQLSGSAYFPAVLFGLNNSIVTSIAANNSHQLVLKSDGTVATFGIGPVNPPSGLNGVMAVAAGGTHDLALKTDGTIVGWISSLVQFTQNFGQTTNPVAATNVVAIAAGYAHSLALRSDGTVYAWGYGLDGATTVPPTATNVVAIAAGGITYTSGFSLALRGDGTVIQWGSAMTSYPVPAGLSNVVAISAGSQHAAAVRRDGSVVTWGYEYVGLAASNQPPDLANVVGIASGGDHDIALFGTRAPAFTVQPWNRDVVISPGKVIGITLSGKVAGVQPMSYQWRLNGTNFPGATNDTLKLTYNLPSGGSVIPPGTYQLVASNSYGVAISKPAKVTLVIPLGDALEATNLNWLTSGGSLWFGQTNITHDGIDAARSGGIGGSQETILQTTFATNVAGNISFWWKVSSEQFFDMLEFRVNGTVQASISGEVDWTQASIPVPAGTNLLQWRYSKDSSFDSGLDAAFVDQFSFVVPPLITLQPFGVVANLGQTVVLNVRVSGSPQLGFQWRKNGDPVGGNTSNLVMNSVARAAAGTYCVTVTNAVGLVVSSNALVVVKVPQLLGAPVLLPDGSLSFTSTDANGGTLTEADLANFEAQASTNLVDWATLPSGLSLTNGMLQLNDASRTNFNSRYYRIVEH